MVRVKQFRQAFRGKKSQATSELVTTFLDTIKKYSMLKGGETVLIGLSGGPDSVCLLQLLNRVKGDLNVALHAVYIDHNLRPDETPGEIALCRELCKKINTAFLVRSIDIDSYRKAYGLNKQEAARELRYRMFDQTALEIKADKIALAHTADDQAETMLMRLIRGSGPKGFSGMPATRGKIIRPLIEVERRVIEHFLETEKIKFIVDSSNLEMDYLRNRIRLSVMPELKKLNPNLVLTLMNTASVLKEEERYFETIVTKTVMKLISRKSDTRIELFLAPMELMDTVLLRRVLRRVIEATGSLRGIRFRHIEDIIKLIKEGNSGARVYLPDHIRVIKGYALLIITSESPVFLGRYELQAGGEVVLKETGTVLKASYAGKESDIGDGKNSVMLGADDMKFPLTIRSRVPGDFFYPFGFGKKKKLQDFFVDEKVPRDERDGVPIVLSGEDIVWVAGLRADERFRITDDTEKILRLVLLKGNM